MKHNLLEDTGTNTVRVTNLTYRFLRSEQRAHESLMITLERILERQLRTFQKQQEGGEKAD